MWWAAPASGARDRVAVRSSQAPPDILVALALHPGSVRVVRGSQAAARGEAEAADLDLEARRREIRRVHAFGPPDVAHGHGAAEGVAVCGRRGGAHDSALAPDRLVAPRQRFGVVQDEADEP